MKKIYALLATSIIASPLWAQTPVIVNPDFEAGFRTVNATSILPPASLSSKAPNGWYCADSLVVGLLPGLAIGGFTNLNVEQQCFEETTNAITSVSVGLKTAPLNDSLQVPGLLSNAKLAVNLASLMQNQSIMDALTYSGGTAALGKQVDQVKLKAFLDTVYREPAQVTILAYGKNPANNNAYELIGEGIKLIQTDTIVQDIDVAMTYNDPTNTATDTLVIVVASGNNPFYVSPGNFNYLIVDDIEATYSEGKIGTIGIENIYTSDDVKIFPVPTSSTLNVVLERYQVANKYTVQLIALDGKVISMQALTAATTQMDVSAYTSGLYRLAVTENGKVVYQQSVSIN